jgi:uncharacterized membrane protein YjfL (UPF0719 family)
MMEELWDLDAAAYYVSFEALAFMLEGLILLWVGKVIKDITTPYNINEELTTKDNKALAVSYAGYMVAQGIIILGVMQGPSEDFVHDLIGVATWSLIGIVLLNVAMFLNDKLLLRKFDNVKEIITDQNVGTGAVQAGTFLGTAFLIRAVIIGESDGSWSNDLTNVAIFFVIGQLGFILFSLVYQGMAKFDIHDEIEKDNAAAGLGFGLTLFAVGVIMGHTILTTLSLAAFGVWFFTGIVLLVLTRILVDKLILPDHKLDKEIAEDRNWGAALIEGGGALIVAFLLNASFA